MSNKRIFISHASKDKSLADALVDLLQTGMNIDANDIFCSSLEGLGIPSGSNFIEYINQQLQSPEIVIALLSPNYYQSQFCLCELGASWAMSLKLIPLVTPGLTYGGLDGVLTSIQVIEISDSKKLTEFQMQMKEALDLKNINFARWEAKRDAFLLRLPNILSDLPKPTIVSLPKYQGLKKKYKESSELLAENDKIISKLKAQIEELKQCKDKDEVKKIEDKYRDSSEIKEFKDIILAIFRLKRQVGNWEVFKFILSTYYGLPYNIDYLSYRDEFNEAERFRIIVDDDRNERMIVNWKNRHMQKLKKTLSTLEDFLHKSTESFSAYYEEKYDSELDPSNQEFWEEHYLR